MTDYRLVLTHLQACMEDPMYADHAEVNKRALHAVIPILDEYIEHCQKGIDSACLIIWRSMKYCEGYPDHVFDVYFTKLEKEKS